MKVGDRVKVNEMAFEDGIDIDCYSYPSVRGIKLLVNYCNGFENDFTIIGYDTVFNVPLIRPSGFKEEDGYYIVSEKYLQLI